MFLIYTSIDNWGWGCTKLATGTMSAIYKEKKMKYRVELELEPFVLVVEAGKADWVAFFSKRTVAESTSIAFKFCAETFSKISWAEAARFSFIKGIVPISIKLNSCSFSFESCELRQKTGKVNKTKPIKKILKN